MRYLSELENSSVVIVGAGLTGLSCARFLSRNGIAPVIVDSRANPPSSSKAQRLVEESGCELGKNWLKPVADADVVIVSPGVAAGVVKKAMKPGAELIGDIELFARLNTKPVIAITGSNGKSTVTTLVGELLKAAGIKAALGGNIGVPALELLSEDVDVIVLELSSFQLETVSSLKPVSATILNITEDHMERYDSFADYVAAKQRIYGHAELIVVNRDDQNTLPAIDRNCVLRSFGHDEPEEQHAGIKDEILYLGKQLVCHTNELNLVGAHNADNVLAALLLLEPFDIELSVLLPALRAFSGLRHRCEKVADIAGVTWINDSKATNPGATLAAINGVHPQLTGNIILIAGGQGKDADFSELGIALNEKTKERIFFGEDKQLLADAVASSHLVQSMEEAVDLASALSQPGDVVLLSPACASFDLFESFEARGEAFEKAVNGLKQNSSRADGVGA